MTNVIRYLSLFLTVTLTIGQYPATAAELTWTGDGSGGSWQDGTAGKFDGTWNNANPDSASFAGTAEIVSLGGAISVSNLTINGAHSSNKYTIQSNTLTFAAGGTIAVNGPNSGHNIDVAVISSAITGSPSVVLGMVNDNSQISFAPTSGSVALGAASGKGLLTLRGSTTGNTLAGASGPKLKLDGSGTWTLTGLASAYEHFVAGGSMIVSGSGTLRSNSRAVKLSAGVLHYNNPGAVFSDASGNSGINDGDNIWFSGGSLDNSSGSPILTSTYNPRMSWGSDWTFIGSLGTNSDLNIGSGAVGLFTSPTVTIESNATFTVGGTIRGDYSLTKGGTGTLKLTGVNTYSGHTTVAAGMLSLGDGTNNSSLADGKDLRIAAASGAKVNLDFVGTDTVFAVLFDGVAADAGTWGAVGNGAADHTTNALTGAGLLYSAAGETTDTHFWDGPTTGGTGDGASDGGAGTWSTSTTNWDHGYVPREVWDNASNDSAIFGGGETGGGAVTLAAPITVSNLTFTGGGYTIAGDTLNFAPGAVLSHSIYNGENTIRAPISGSPDVNNTVYNATKTGPNQAYNGITFAPTNGTMELGTATGIASGIWLGGTTTGNVLSNMVGGTGQQFCLRKMDSGTWTVGDIYCGFLSIEGGTLICNATMNFDYSGFKSMLGGRLTGNCRIGDGVGADIPYSFSVNDGAILSPGDNGAGAITFEWGYRNANRTMTMADGSIIEWDVGVGTNDVIHLIGDSGASYTETLDLNNFILKIRDDGGAPKPTDKLPVFTYTDMVIDTNGFDNAAANFDATEVEAWAGGPLSLVDDGNGTIYLAGLAKPPSGSVMIVR